MSTNEWKKNFAPDQIAKKLEDCKKINAQGQLTFRGFEFHEYRILLTEMFDTSEYIPYVEKENIILESIRNVGKRDKITARKLRNEIRRLIQLFETKQEVTYVLISTLSVNKDFKIHRRRINNCTVTFHSKLERNFYNEYDKQKQAADNHLSWIFPKDYIYSKIYTKAKSPSQATEKALYSLDLLRGIWNLELNRIQSIRISLGGLIKPINKIALGPIETLHLTDGKLATQEFWYQPEYQQPLAVFNNSTTISKLFDYEKKVRILIRDHKYKSDIEKLIIRYVQAGDLYNFQDSFIRFWGLLETLTGKKFHTHDDVIKKTIFLYSNTDNEYLRQLLNILKEFRNEAVHLGSNSKNIETLVFILKKFVEALLYFHINNKFKFNSLHEATEFFELTQSQDMFKKQMKRLQNLKKFRRW